MEKLIIKIDKNIPWDFQHIIKKWVVNKKTSFIDDLGIGKEKGEIVDMSFGSKKKGIVVEAHQILIYKTAKCLNFKLVNNKTE